MPGPCSSLLVALHLMAVLQVLVEASSASFGGAIYCETSGTLQLNNVLLSGNNASTQGAFASWARRSVDASCVAFSPVSSCCDMLLLLLTTALPVCVVEQAAPWPWPTAAAPPFRTPR